MIKTLFVITILSLVSCTTTHEQIKITPKNSITFINFTEPQKDSLLDAFSKLESLSAGFLKIPRRVYDKRSDFQKLYGFKFSGKKLARWITQRVKKITVFNDWTVSTNDKTGDLSLSEEFFNLTMLERIYTLVHEARHSDPKSPEHVKCPQKSYPFVSSGSPQIVLNEKESCDDKPLGAYHYHASFLFECYAFGLIDQKTAGLLYNSSIARVLPLISKQK